MWIWILLLGESSMCELFGSIFLWILFVVVWIICVVGGVVWWVYRFNV